jgi:hypothetical protein
MAAAFSASDVAFEGFRLARERPLSIVVWAGLTLALSLISAVLMVGLAGDAMAAMMAASNQQTSDPAEAMAAMSGLAPAYGLLTPLALAFYAVLYAAAYRAVLRPREAPGSGDVKLGGDELRQALALVAVGLIVFAAFFVVMLLAGIVLGAVGVAAGGGAGVAVGAVVFVLALGFIIWLMVKLSLVGPYTFDRRSLDLPAAWRMTKGATSKLAGAYLLAFALMMVVYLLGLVIFAAAAAILAGGPDAFASIMTPDFSSFSGYFTPAMLIYLVVASLLSALTFAILVGATAAAYRALSPDRTVEAFA